MRYYISTLERVKFASNLAHRLSRPKQIPETQNDITEYVFSWHTKNNEACAIVDPKKTLCIHQFIRDSVKNGNGVSHFFDKFYLTPQEAEEKKQIIVNSRDKDGGLIVSIPILSILPSDWQEVTKKYLQQNGWFLEEI